MHLEETAFSEFWLTTHQASETVRQDWSYICKRKTKGWIDWRRFLIMNQGVMGTRGAAGRAATVLLSVPRGCPGKGLCFVLCTCARWRNGKSWFRSADETWSANLMCCDWGKPACAATCLSVVSLMLFQNQKFLNFSEVELTNFEFCRSSFGNHV